MPKILTMPAKKAQPNNVFSAQQLRYTGNELRRHRLERKMTVKELAGKAGCSPKVIYALEVGSSWCCVPTYAAICVAIGYGRPPML